MAVHVDGDRADRAIFDVDRRTPPAGQQLVELAPPLGGLEPGVVDLLEPCSRANWSAPSPVRKTCGLLLHHRPREADRARVVVSPATAPARGCGRP